MASIRSYFRQRNVQCFSKRSWINCTVNNQNILRYVAAPMSILPQHIPKQALHKMATGNSPTIHVPLLGPSVRHLLDSYGLDRQSIKPSGHKGQLLKGDVLQYIREHGKTKIKFTQILKEKSPVLDSIALESNIGYVDLGVSDTRKETARQLVESKITIPHTYSTIDCNVDHLISLCSKFNKSVSVYDFVIKAAALALRLVPSVNSSWSDSGPVQHTDINIGIAVHSSDGVITPVITNADQLEVSNISQKVMEFKEKSKTGMITSEPNASFIITNLENTGVKSSTAIINHPQSALLTLGDQQTIVNDNYKTFRVINVTLCCDGRIIDEQLASEWLTIFKSFTENPLQMGL